MKKRSGTWTARATWSGIGVVMAYGIAAAPMARAAGDDETCHKACDTYAQSRVAAGDEAFKEGFKQAQGSSFHGAKKELYCGCGYDIPRNHRTCVTPAGVETPMNNCQDAPQPDVDGHASAPAAAGGGGDSSGRQGTEPGSVDFGIKPAAASGSSGSGGH